MFQRWREICKTDVEERIEMVRLSSMFTVDELVLCIADKIIILYLQDIRSFFSPKGKTSKPGPSNVEDKRGKDSSVKDLGKGRAKSKVRIFDLTLNY